MVVQGSSGSKPSLDPGFQYTGGKPSETCEALAWGTKFKRNLQISEIKIDNILMQYFKIKINAKIHDEQNMNNFK